MDTTKSAADWADAHWSPLTGEGTELTSFNTWHHRRFGFVDHRNVTCASRWAIWQASREAVVVELGAPSHWVADYAACGGGMTVFDAEKAAKVTDPMCLKTPAYTVHALEKAGLKVAP